MYNYVNQEVIGSRSAGLVLQFNREDTNELTNWFLNINDFYRFLNESGKHSINRLDVLNYGGIPISYKKAIKYFQYDVKKMLQDSIG
jgi:hypothetical protein